MQLHVGGRHLAADVALALDVAGHEHLVIAAKSTWTIPETGQRPRPLAPQPLVLADEFYGEPGESPIRYGADMARFKPRCDVIFDACAHAPGGVPVRQLVAGFELGPLSRRLRVTGARRWQGRGNDPRSFQLSEPDSFVRLPLHHGFAFGGTRWFDHQGERWCDTHEANPVGVGFVGPRTVPQAADLAGPQIELMEAPVRRPDDALAPQALSAVARHWQPRRALGGTYDDEWRREVFPLLPLDFDDAYNQVAPVEQQMPYPVGGERVELMHLMAGRPHVIFQLPRLSLKVRVLRTNYEQEAPDAVVDTLFFEPEHRRFSAVWRASVPIHRHLHEIADVAIGPVDPGWWKARGEGKVGGCSGCGGSGESGESGGSSLRRCKRNKP